MTWLAFGCVHPAFAADAPPLPPLTTQIIDDAIADSQPAEAVMFLGKGADTPAAAAPEGKRSSSWRLAPIITRFGGDVGYQIEQRSNSDRNATLRQRLVLNLRGKGITYISKPWLAQVKGDFIFTASKDKIDEFQSSNNAINGNAGLYLVPYSRYPFEAVIARNQFYTGPGIGSLNNQSTRLDLRQRYTPLDKRDNYYATYYRSRTESDGYKGDRLTGLGFQISSNRFHYQSLSVDGNRERYTRLDDGKYTLINAAHVDHSYRPSNALSLLSNASIASSSEHAVLPAVSSRYRELHSTLSWQPVQAPYSVIGSARVNAFDYENYPLSSSQTRTANANLGVNYRPSRFITLSASGNVNVTEKNSAVTRTVSTYQAATANYPLASFNLDSYHYDSRIYGNVSNRTNSSDPLRSSQSISVTPSHTLSHGMPFGGGNLNTRIEQSLLLSENSRTNPDSTLRHSGWVNWQRTQGKSHTLLQLNAQDSRSLRSTHDVFQYVSIVAAITENISRYSQLTGDLTVSTARQVTQTSSITTNSSVAALSYNNQRAFDVSRLTFLSSLRAFSRAPIPVLVAPANEQGPVTWENTLSYVVGRLTAEFRVNLSKDGDGKAQSLIFLSLKRYF